ncbi:hypothetical protein LI063_05810 [Clostridium perfringens]|nr:hypothetical protein [Clostridium perfringens]MCX0363674.1 hypothetical protein [Clostridium perfringens]
MRLTKFYLIACKMSTLEGFYGLGKGINLERIYIKSQAKEKERFEVIGG